MVALLSVRGLGVQRGGVPLLQGVDFALEAGAALIVRGPNGVGKTTLLRTLARLQPPASGVVSGGDVAYAAHADGLKATLTVLENLQFWARMYGTGTAGAGGTATALAAMDLARLAHRLAHNLSAGQKRRLGLARLMVAGRRVWVLDEPTVSLDAASVALCVAMVRAHLAGGGAAVIATHLDLGLAEASLLDLAPFRAVAPMAADGFGDAEAFA